MPNIVEIVIRATNQSKAAFAETEASGATLSSKLTKVGLIGAAGLIAVGAASVDMASKYQTSTTKLVTSANEQTKNIGMVRQGMLDMAGQVGISAEDLSKGMYVVESAGEHGAAGLIVLKAAAQGAKDENADLATVANAVTDVLTDYHLKAGQAANVTSQLVKAVSFGKTNFQDFSQSLSNVLPLAGSLHLKLADVSGVLAEMTAHGMSAQRASEDEANAMRHLAVPTGTMRKEFDLLGISSDDVQKKMSTVGLGGTMQWLSSVAQKGAGAVGQTYTGAFSKLLGSASALSVGLMTTGKNAGDTNAAISGIGKASADAQGNVAGFSEVQKNFGQQLDQVKAAGGALAIEFGNKLMPSLQSTIGWISTHQSVVIALAKAILVAVAALAAYALVTKTVAAAQAALDIVMDMNPFVAIGIAVVAIAAVVIKYHTHIWTFIQKTWNTVFSFLKNLWGAIWSFAQQWWPLIFGAAGLIYKYHTQILNFIENVWNRIFSFLRNLWGSIEGQARAAWSNVYNGVVGAWNAILRFFQNIPGRVIGAVGNANNLLINWGKGVINGLLQGITSSVTAVWNFIKGIPGKILKFLGINSPPKWSIEAGEHIMNGVGIGMNNAQAKSKAAAIAYAKSLRVGLGGGTSGVGAGVQQWAGTVRMALAMEGLNQGLAHNVLYQMQTESGGNQNAINLTDTNALLGTPSKGLMQVIDPTFQEYHWPGTSGNIYNPLANIAAALNYAKNVYGPTLMSGGMGIGSGHGYAAGGATSSGWAMLGERGRELVRLPGGSTVMPHGNTEAMLSSGRVIQIVVSYDGSMKRAGISEDLLKDIRYTVRTVGGRGPNATQKTFGVA